MNPTAGEHMREAISLAAGMFGKRDLTSEEVDAIASACFAVMLMRLNDLLDLNLDYGSHAPDTVRQGQR